jgi:hypothetical protein
LFSKSEVLPAVAVKGRIAREGPGLAKPAATAHCTGCKSGPADACTFDTLISVRVDDLENSVRDIDSLKGGSGLYLQ